MKYSTKVLMLIIATLLFTSVSSAQKSAVTVDGCFGLKFGTNMSESKKILTAAKFDVRTVDTDLEIDSVKFEGYDTKVLFIFKDGKFNECYITFPGWEVSIDHRNAKIYGELKDIYAKRYGKVSDRKLVGAGEAVIWMTKSGDGKSFAIVLAETYFKEDKKLHPQLSFIYDFIYEP